MKKGKQEQYIKERRCDR
ncbi:hypothetical protein ACNKHV_23415 [Shigella flexneri]